MYKLSDVFDKIVDHTIEVEGGFTLDPKDPGNYAMRDGVKVLVGTKYGISAKQYPHVDIKSMTKEGAQSIYKSDYWSSLESMLKKVWGNELDSNQARSAALMFDIAVNSGHKNMIRTIQIAGNIEVDGIYGSKTANALRNLDFNELCLARIAFYARLKIFNRYGRGWIMRTITIQRKLKGLYK